MTKWLKWRSEAPYCSSAHQQCNWETWQHTTLLLLCRKALSNCWKHFNLICFVWWDYRHIKASARGEEIEFRVEQAEAGCRHSLVNEQAWEENKFVHKAENLYWMTMISGYSGSTTLIQHNSAVKITAWIQHVINCNFMSVNCRLW